MLLNAGGNNDQDQMFTDGHWINQSLLLSLSLSLSHTYTHTQAKRNNLLHGSGTSRSSAALSSALSSDPKIFGGLLALHLLDCDIKLVVIFMEP